MFIPLGQRTHVRILDTAVQPSHTSRGTHRSVSILTELVPTYVLHPQSTHVDLVHAPKLLDLALNHCCPDHPTGPPDPS